MYRYGSFALALTLCGSIAFMAITSISIPSMASAQNASEPAPSLNTTAQQASYAIGLNIGRNIQSDGINVDIEAILRGLKDALTKQDPLLTDEQCRAAMMQFQKEEQAKMAARDKLEGEKNKQDGAAYLAANKAKQGVVTTQSGLQYEVLKRGNGPTPKLSDTVRTHYHGTLIDGSVFDSSVRRGEPVEFPVGGVIRGWTEALQMMKVGDKWRLTIPSELAYGSRGAGEAIGPNSVLVFEIELLGIKQPE